MGNFQKLKVWEISKNLTIEIYNLMHKNEHIKRDLRFRSQITSSALSIASNIAEGDKLMSQKQSIKHFYIAKGSCAELKTQLIIAIEIGIISNKEGRSLIKECQIISSMLYNLIKVRSQTINHKP